MRGRVLAVAVTLWGAAGSAQVDPARALLRQGVELRRLGANAEALGVVERAWALCRCDEAMVERAITEQSLGRWVDAAEHMDAVRADSGDPWVARNREAIAAARARIAREVAWLELRVSPDDARVWIAGVDRGTARRVRVARGEVTLRVESAGHVAETRVVRVEEEAARVEVTLAREAVVAEAEAPRVVVRDVTSAPPRRSLRAWVWGSAVLAGVAAAGAGVAWWAREEAVGRYNDPQCATAFASREERCGAYARAAEVNAGIAIGSAVVAGIAGVAAVVLGVVDGRRPRRERAWGCWVTGEGGGCGGRF